MRLRVLQLLGVGATVTVVSVLMMGTLTGQAPTAPQQGTPLKTSWGEPDLMGIWTINYQVPLERPGKYKDKEFFTDAEIAELDNERKVKPQFGEKRGDRGTERDVAGAYDSQVFLMRRHTGKRTSLIVDPPNGKLPPLTERARAKNRELREFQLAHLEATEACKNNYRGCEGGKYTGVPSPRMQEPYKDYPGLIQVNRADGPEDHGLGMRCLSSPMPDFGSFLSGFWFIVQSPQGASIFYDTGQGQGWHRTVPVDGSPHLPSSIRLWFGDSRGHWEGDTLVIDVTNFTPKTNYRGANTGNLHLIERWRRTGPETLEYRVTVEDPTTWTRPWTAVQDLYKQEYKYNRIYKEPRCIEGNYSIFGWLAGARAKEQAFSEGRGPNPATINYATDTFSALEGDDFDDLM
jgi:hypothetical protein